MLAWLQPGWFDNLSNLLKGGWILSSFSDILQLWMGQAGCIFVAMEDPESMAKDVQAFFHDLKAKN